jgi:putative hydroxymethylpyrimidine transport system substrate-binding protein
MLARPMGPVRVALLAALIASSLAAAAGCGGTTGADRPERPATLLLDVRPNAVHAGIYLALERDFDGAEGVELRARAPGASTDAARLLASGRADMAILDVHDLALARQEGQDVVGVMAVVQRPLAAVLAQPSIRRPRELEGRRVGVTGLPGDEAVLASIVRGDGADPERVRTVTIGSRAVSALLSRRVAGATAFWNAEGVELRRRRPSTREFRVEAFGAPAYPELVLSVARRTLTENRAVVRATVDALRRGYGDALTDPESAISALVQRNPSVDRGAAQRGFDAVSPAFTVGARRFGELDRARLGAWARWEARFGVTERPPDVAQAFEFGF